MKVHSLMKNLPFRSNITFDIGGSQREGSCKIYYATTEDDEVIFTQNTTVNEVGVPTFESPEDFMDKIAHKVRNIQENNKKNIKEMGYPKEENEIRSMTIMIPSYTEGTFAYYLPNHKNKENRPLKDLDFSQMRDLLIQKGVKISADMRFRVLQDAMGTGLAVAKRLYDNAMLKPGKYFTACITGGGCGVSTIEMYDDENVIVKSTGSGYLATSDRLEKVSRAGASAPAIIRNFLKPFGINDELVEDIVNCHKAEFTMMNPIRFGKDVKTERLKEFLLSTGKYELLKDEEDSFVLRIKPEFETQFERCREHAIDKYCQAFARLAAIKRNEACNGLIITGPLARSINRASQEFYHQSITERINRHVFGSYSTFELEKMQHTYNFEVICDERFFIDDNTACKKLAHIAQYVSPNRGNWLKIPVSALRDSANY